MADVGQLDLPTGRQVQLCELRQFFTYEGLIEGLPTAERNKQRVERLVAEYRNGIYADGVHLIRPTETPIEYPSGRPYPFGTPSALPSVTCIGRFTSLDPARDKRCDLSGLIVIWFQQELAFPIDVAVRAKLLAIDWDALAVDIYY